MVKIEIIEFSTFLRNFIPLIQEINGNIPLTYSDSYSKILLLRYHNQLISLDYPSMLCMREGQSKDICGWERAIRMTLTSLSEDFG